MMDSAQMEEVLATLANIRRDRREAEARDWDRLLLFCERQTQYPSAFRRMVANNMRLGIASHRQIHCMAAAAQRLGVRFESDRYRELVNYEALHEGEPACPQCRDRGQWEYM